MYKTFFFSDRIVLLSLLCYLFTSYPSLTSALASQNIGNHLPRRCSPSIPVSNSHTSTALQLSGGFFDNIGKFFGDDGKENSDEAGKKPLERETTLNKQSEVDDFILNEVEEDYPGSTLIFHMKGTFHALRVHLISCKTLVSMF